MARYRLVACQHARLQRQIRHKAEVVIGNSAVDKELCAHTKILKKEKWVKKFCNFIVSDKISRRAYSVSYACPKLSVGDVLAEN